MDVETAVEALPGLDKDIVTQAEAWLNSPLGATVRRLGAVLVAALYPIIFGWVSKYIPLPSGVNADVVTGIVELVIAAYVIQSASHSKAKVIASGQVEAAKVVTDRATAIAQLNKPVNS